MHTFPVYPNGHYVWRANTCVKFLCILRASMPGKLMIARIYLGIVKAAMLGKSKHSVMVLCILRAAMPGKLNIAEIACVP